MGKKWTIEEDRLVIAFYLKNRDLERVCFDELYEQFSINGFIRSKLTIRDRFYNYKYLDKRSGLSHASKQQKMLLSHKIGIMLVSAKNFRSKSWYHVGILKTKSYKCVDTIRHFFI